MDKSAFLEKVKEQYLDAVDGLDFDANFREMGSYDSLTGMTIMVMIKDDYGVDLTEAEYRSKKTLQELFDFVSEKTA